MIILRRHEPRVLLPMKRSEWNPSQYVPKDELGNDTTHYSFVARVRLSDGFIAWQGRFADRDDFDAFIFAHVTGSLRYDRSLWRLPVPEWIPGLYDDLVLEFATDVFLTTTGTSNTWTVASDWNSASNTVHCIGAGGSGARGRPPNSGTRSFASGGGGGGYGNAANLSLTPSGSVTYGVGAGHTPTGGTTTISGTAGGDTYFNAASYAAASVGGAGGVGGPVSNSASVTGALGGAGKGDVSYSGGQAGSITNTGVFRIGSGAGGAGGPNGVGGDGDDSPGTATGGTAGGAGDNGSGGAGGVSGGGAAGDGTEWSGTPYGSGGGGGGRGQASAATGGAAGNYGGGGGGMAAYSGSPIGGPSRQGLIFITYTPTTTGSFFNLAMLGM